MKILIAADLGPNKIGSLEQQLFLVGKLLESHGATVSFAFSGGVGDSVKSAFDLGARELHTDLGPLGEPSARDNWIRLLESRRPDALWLHFFPVTGQFAQRIRRACPKARIVLTEHVSRGYPSPNPLKVMLRYGRSLLSRNSANRCIAVSRFVADRLKRVDFVPADRVETIYNGIDLDRFQPDPVKSNYGAAVCYMRPEKGVHVLLEALALLKRRGEEIEFRLVGVGPQLETYRAFAAEHGLSGVEFLGLRDDVQDILRSAALSVVPSVWPEAFGLAAAEALAVGTPVIASDIGGLPEVVEHGVTGLLVPPARPDLLADAVSSLMADAVTRSAMGQAARRRTENLFNLGVQAERIVQVILN